MSKILQLLTQRLLDLLFFLHPEISKMLAWFVCN